MFVVIIFSILWIVRPISYDEMRSRHPIYSQENVVVVKIGDKTYTLNNPYKDGADELQYKLAEKLYNDCRKDNKDVYEIAEKNTLKKENVQKCKDHIFNNEHLLDQYEELGEPAEYKKFDPNLKQALAWERFKDGIPTKEDIEWLRHEDMSL